MNTIDSNSISSKVNGILRIENGPALGGGSLPAESDRTWVILAQLFPIIAWPLKRHASPAVDAYGKETLNFCITNFICMFVGGFIAGFLGSVVAGAFSLLSSLVSLAVFGLVIYSIILSGQGKLLRYPLNFRFIK